MTTFSLDDSLIVSSVRAVSSAETFDSCADELAVMSERFARAAWTGIAEPGDAIAGRLVRTLGATAALSALIERRNSAEVHNELSRAGLAEVSLRDLDLAYERWMPRVVSHATFTAIRLAAHCGARLMTPADADWPPSLADLGSHEPLALWVRGTSGSSSTLGHAVALVGARAATGYGEHVAMELAAGLSDRGFTVVSGAAYGIDGMAHRAALASAGSTVAFLAGGVDRFYPSGHDALLARIVETGAVISELPCGAPPTKWRFLQRNRLIAAATQGTVVVEAGNRSGSLNTAAHAVSIGRPLGAVPGPVTSIASAGCHRLLREFDAVCVTSPDEVVELISSDVSERSLPTQARSSDETRILDAVSLRSARSASEVAQRAGLSVTAAQSGLGLLQLEGLVSEAETGWKRRKR